MAANSSLLQNTTHFPLGDGNSIPCIGFGTYQIKDEDVVTPVVTALSMGYTHIDTAEIYKNEAGVGNAIAQWFQSGGSRDKLFVTTKLWPGNPDWGMEPKTYESTIESCQESIKKLQLDIVDLYLIHTPLGGGKEGRLAQYKGLVECQRLGMCKSIGVSNYGIHHLMEIEEAGLPLPSCNQIELHPYCQKPELVEYMKSKNISIIAYSSLAPLSTWRQGQQSAKTDDARQKESPFAGMATQHQCSESSILLRWALQKGYAILPKSTHPERIASNFDLFQDQIALSEEEMGVLNGLDRNAFLAFGNSEAPFDPSTAP
jgi:2,5-diketo-D-gluconate reductase A